MLRYEPRWAEPEPHRRPLRDTTRATLAALLVIAVLALLTIFLAPLFYLAPLAAVPRALRLA